MAASSSKHFQLPISRVKTIMKSSPDVENVSSESIHLVAKATELFIQYLAQESLINSNSAAELRYEDLAEIVDKDQRLEFLRVPCNSINVKATPENSDNCKAKKGWRG
ncbi:hypothetical protein RUM44_002681 [Polyplax serrata]|uniref:Transcription factor CBF/NF-Y/archaeal histone domain-containing protein n=1 Tax=Polyplax serrata TaxID=468196 RepID=A0ABR1AFI3_POLSC